LTSGFFHESVSPKALSIPLGPFQIFSKIAEIFAVQSAPTSVVDTCGKWKKIFNQKYFNYFVWTPLGRRINIYINFCLQVHFKVSAACSHYLPPVSTTQAELVAKFDTGVIDTGGKFDGGVVDTGGNFATGIIDTSGAPVHLDLRISPRIFGKNSD
jgi:hypothetical protein